MLLLYVLAFRLSLPFYWHKTTYFNYLKMKNTKWPDFPLPSSPIKAKLTSLVPCDPLRLRIMSRLRFEMEVCIALMLDISLAHCIQSIEASKQ